MTEDFVQKIYSLFMANKMGHAFLIETNSADKTYQKLQTLIKKINCPSFYNESCQEDCNVCYQIDNYCLPSVKYIEPSGQTIKKEQMMIVKNQFASDSLITKYNVYIVKNAEKLNTSSANVILKFLEDPTTKTLAFFVLGNKKNIIPTIKSRCQIFEDLNNEASALNLSSDKLEQFGVKMTKILNNLINEKTLSLITNKQEIADILDKKEQEQFLNFMLLNIEKEIKNIVSKKSESGFSLGFNLKKMLSFAKITKDIIEKATYNVNMELLFDDYFIKIGELMLWIYME